METKLADAASGMIIRAMYDIADAMIQYMADDATIPVDTHNLKDGIGVAVFHDGALKKFLMNPRAVKPRENIVVGGTSYGTLWGKDAIKAVMDNGMMKYGYGYSVVLYSSMPYDVEQDTSGINEGFFSYELTREFKETVDEIIHRYKRQDNEVIRI